MKKIAILAGMIAFCSSASLLAQDEQDVARTAQATEQAQAEEAELSEEEQRMQEVVCRTEPVTGSRTRVNRTCLTRADWRAIEMHTREGVDEMQGNAAGGYACRPDSVGGCN